MAEHRHASEVRFLEKKHLRQVHQCAMSAPHMGPQRLQHHQEPTLNPCDCRNLNDLNVAMTGGSSLHPHSPQSLHTCPCQCAVLQRISRAAGHDQKIAISQHDLLRLACKTLTGPGLQRGPPSSPLCPSPPHARAPLAQGSTTLLGQTGRPTDSAEHRLAPQSPPEQD